MRGAWIGLSDVVEESTFVWIDGSALNYSHWDNGEPNNQGNNADYVWIYGPSGRHYGFWDDISGTTRVDFICERQLRTLEGKYV